MSVSRAGSARHRLSCGRCCRLRPLIGQGRQLAPDVSGEGDLAGTFGPLGEGNQPFDRIDPGPVEKGA